MSKGYETVVVGTGAGQCASKHGYPIKADVAASQVKSDDLVHAGAEFVDREV